VEDTRLAEIVSENFSLTPAGMIRHLNLRRPIYQKTAAFGHFGRSEDSFSWEATDKAEALREASQLTASAV
jgi:S-adenosylmethionine synthetase